MSAQQVCNSSSDQDSVVLYHINNIETDKNNKCFRKHGIYFLQQALHYTNISSLFMRAWVGQ